MPEETPKAAQAFSDYEAMGDGRSLRKLVELYRAQSATGEDVPTEREMTLKQWSVDHGWQARIIALVEEEAEAVRLALRKSTIRFRDNVATGIRADVNRYLTALAKDDDQGAKMAEDAGSLVKLTELYFKLAEEPLADRHEFGNAGGTPFVVAQFGPDDLGAGVGGNGDTPDPDEPEVLAEAQPGGGNGDGH